MKDTICAISTPSGQGGIAMIRVSGEEAIYVVNGLFKGKNIENVKSHTIHYGHIIAEGTVLDEVLVSVMRAPKTFTKEDVVEISCHGGMFVATKIVEHLLVNGCRLAEPGEFTKRAFLNGRIDLVQAEAVMDIIHAKNASALSLANKGLSGQVSRQVNAFRSKLLFLIAQIEVNIDYPEYDDVIMMQNAILKPQIYDLLSSLDRILQNAYKGKVLKDGIKTAIVGRPNVGKSSLLNRLLDEERAIVTEIAGTTRDLIEGQLNLGNITLNLIDTAGIRQTDDIVEQIGVKRSEKAISDAELVILVLDNSTKLTQEDKALLDLTISKPRIIVVNKIDLDPQLELDLENVVYVSALKEVGIEELEQHILKVIGINDFKEQDLNYLSNVRHIAKLKAAQKSLQDALGTIEESMPVDMVEIDLKDAWTRLGEIVGEVSSDDLLDELFSQFCLGK